MNFKDLLKFCENGDLKNTKLFLSSNISYIKNDSYFLYACKSENLELVKLLWEDNRIDSMYKIEESFQYLLNNKLINIIDFLIFQTNTVFDYDTVYSKLWDLVNSYPFFSNSENNDFIFSFIDKLFEIKKFDYMLLSPLLYDDFLKFYKYIFEHEKFSSYKELKQLLRVIPCITRYKQNNYHRDKYHKSLSYLLQSEFIDFNLKYCKYVLDNIAIILKSIKEKKYPLNKILEQSEFELDYHLYIL